VDVGQGNFNISYVDGSSSIGDYFTDTFQIGSATLHNLTMGLGIETNIPFGLAGVGYEINEASLGTTKTTYPNLPVAMMQDGLINTVAYSLWLNDLGMFSYPSISINSITWLTFEKMQVPAASSLEELIPRNTSAT
jgi:Eukaryotic aspartyl protease